MESRGAPPLFNKEGPADTSDNHAAWHYRSPKHPSQWAEWHCLLRGECPPPRIVIQ